MHSNVTPEYPLSFIPQRSLDAQAREPAYEAIADRHQSAAAGIVSRIVAGAQLLRPGALDQQDTLEAVGWFVDNTVADEDFMSFAVRARAVLRAASDETPGPPGDDVLLPDPIVPDDSWSEYLRNEWSGTGGYARFLGAQGLHVVGLEMREVVLYKTTRAETTRRTPGHAQFTHVLARDKEGEVIATDHYKADPTTGTLVKVAALPSYPAVVQQAYDRFGMEHAQKVWKRYNYGADLRAAISADLMATGVQTDNMAEFRERTRTVAMPMQRVSQLAASLHTAEPTKPTQRLMAQLLELDVGDIALWGELYKGSYYHTTIAHGGNVLANRLKWAKGPGAMCGFLTRNAMEADSAGFNTSLAREIMRLSLEGGMVESAERIEDMLANKTFTTVHSDWKVAAM